MRGQSRTEKEDAPLRAYMERLQVLEKDLDNGDLLTALKDQIWVVQAIVNSAGLPAVQSTARRLLVLIENDDYGDSIRQAVTSLLSTWQEEQTAAHANNKKTYKWAAWSGVSATLSTIFAILLGREGLLPVIQKATQHGGTRVPPPVLNPVSVVQYSQSDFSIALLHVFVIGLFLLLRFTNLGRPPAIANTSESTRKAYSQFQRGWEFIWLSWLALYVWFSLIWGLARLGFSNVPISIFWSVADICNAGSALAFLYIFLIMDMPSVDRKESPGDTEKFRSTLLFAAIFSCVIAALSILGRFELWGLGLGGPNVLSLFVAICMAYFFGRLDSHYLRASRWMLAPFYLYVVIQVDWVNLADSGSSYRPIILSLALILKVYLFVVMTHWIHSGYIHAYLTMAASAHEPTEKGLEELRLQRTRAPED